MRSIVKSSWYPFSWAHLLNASKPVFPLHSLHTEIPRPPYLGYFWFLGLLHRVFMFFHILWSRVPVAPWVLFAAPLLANSRWRHPQDFDCPSKASSEYVRLIATRAFTVVVSPLCTTWLNIVIGAIENRPSAKCFSGQINQFSHATHALLAFIYRTLTITYCG